MLNLGLPVHIIYPDKVVIEIVSQLPFQKPRHDVRFWFPEAAEEPLSGRYEYTFEQMLQADGTAFWCDQLVLRAKQLGALAGIQAALRLVENQQLLPASITAAHRLIFAGTWGVLGNDGKQVACVEKRHDRWEMTWARYNDEFDDNTLVVRVTKL